MNWGPFTYCRNADAERTINSICHAVRDIVGSHVSDGAVRALALIGGYGRGEGGVESGESGARLHNNLDFMLVTKGLSEKATRAAVNAINEALMPIRSQSDVGIDFSAVTERKLRSSDCLVMWYDMRFGHRLIAGDGCFMSSLTQFDVAHIPSWNVRDLLVNRGTLLILNRWLSENASDVHPAEGATCNALSRQLIRHLVKAIIGYGDALLYFDHQYHWSYVEKMHRIKSCRFATPEFVQLYTDAAEFRLCPSYGTLASLDILGWQAEVVQTLAKLHLRCEAMRLETPIRDWESYANIAGSEEFWRQRQSPKTWARKIVRMAQSGRQTPHLSRFHWGARCAGERGRMSLAFPVIAYEVRELYPWAHRLLGGDPRSAWSESEQHSQLLASYIDHWGRVGDANFRYMLDRFTPQSQDARDSLGQQEASAERCPTLMEARS